MGSARRRKKLLQRVGSERKRMMEREDKRRCPVCHRLADDWEVCCTCGYEFGSNRCANPGCRRHCGDFTGFCPVCGSETVNFLDGYVAGIATNLPRE